MLLVFSVRLASTIHYYLQVFAPTNILLRHLRTRGGLKWAVPVALIPVPTYPVAAAITTAVIADGGPSWLNLVVLTCTWNAMKFAWVAVLSPLHLMLSRAATGRRRLAATSRRRRHVGLSEGSQGRLGNLVGVTARPVRERCVGAV